MIVWVNGAFSAGKTTACRELEELIPGSTFYDPEMVGWALRLIMPAKRLKEVDDYQDLRIWRRLVVESAAALLQEVGGVLITPMTLLRQEYRDEIFGGLAARGVSVQHILLDLEETILRERIARRDEVPEDPEASASVRTWALDHIAPYHEALSWIASDAHVIEAGGLTPRQTAERIAEAVRTGAGACGIVQTLEPTAETIAAGVLLFDERDRVLLVDPTYKPGWEFPGGVVERGESPAQGAIREVAEELGLELPGAPKLLVVDWEPPVPPGFGGLRFLFDGGRLPSALADRLLLPGAELRGWRFVTEEEAATMLPPVRLSRLRRALRAREHGTVLNLEAGVPVG